MTSQQINSEGYNGKGSLGSFIECYRFPPFSECKFSTDLDDALSDLDIDNEPPKVKYLQ